MGTGFNGERVAVIGCPGSGKSTFSLKLAALTGLPLFHLDNIWWKSDGTHIPREEFDRILSEILKKDKWIIDGFYSRTLERRIVSCDTVVFCDLDLDTCLEGIGERVGKARPDMPWIEKSPDPELEELVRDFHKDGRGAVLSLLAD
ncbi:MAG: adenylate kinase, partial [Clostridia bacterium]|nr:adenylate kinase [Clostridia bacterium]